MDNSLTKTLSALADPTRRRILARLSNGSATVKELAEPFDLSLSTISKHISVLEQAKLIERGRKAQWRPCTLRPEPLREAADWLERFRQLWESNFRELDLLLDSLQADDPKTQDDE